MQDRAGRGGCRSYGGVPAPFRFHLFRLGRDYRGAFCIRKDGLGQSDRSTGGVSGSFRGCVSPVSSDARPVSFRAIVSTFEQTSDGHRCYIIISIPANPAHRKRREWHPGWAVFSGDFFPCWRRPASESSDRERSPETARSAVRGQARWNNGRSMSWPAPMRGWKTSLTP
jgi:hypothetical protein